MNKQKDVLYYLQGGGFMNKKTILLITVFSLVGFTNIAAQRGNKKVNPQSKQFKYSTTVGDQE